MRLRDSGTTIVFSSHVMSEVLELSDRVLVMADGRLVGDDEPRALMANSGCDNLEDTFVALAYGQVESSEREALV